MESQFKENDMNLGKVSVGQKQTLHFKLVDSTTKIKELKASCSRCTKVKVTKDGVKAIFTPEAVPPHLKEQGHYHVTKMINVFFTDGTLEKLRITAIVYK